MPDTVIDWNTVLKRIDDLRETRDDGRRETKEEFGERCGFSGTLLSHWHRETKPERPSLETLERIVQAHPGWSLDRLVYGKVRDEAPYDLVERLVEDIAKAVNRTSGSLPKGRARFLRVELGGIDPE